MPDVMFCFLLRMHRHVIHFIFSKLLYQTNFVVRYTEVQNLFLFSMSVAYLISSTVALFACLLIIIMTHHLINTEVVSMFCRK